MRWTRRALEMLGCLLVSASTAPCATIDPCVRTALDAAVAELEQTGAIPSTPGGVSFKIGVGFDLDSLATTIPHLATGSFTVAINVEVIDGALGAGAACSPSVLLCILMHELDHLILALAGASTSACGGKCEEMTIHFNDLALICAKVGDCTDPGEKRFLCNQYAEIYCWITSNLDEVNFSCAGAAWPEPANCEWC